MYAFDPVYLVLLIFPISMAFAGAMDMVTMTIPNRVSLALIVGFAAAAVAVGMDLEAFASHLAVGAVMLVVGIALFAFRIVGGGDAKLLAAASLWIGFDQLAIYMMYVAVLGGLLSVAILLYRHILPPVWLAKQTWAMRLHQRNVGIPYGIAIGGAGLIMFPVLPWMVAGASA